MNKTARALFLSALAVVILLAGGLWACDSSTDSEPSATIAQGTSQMTSSPESTPSGTGWVEVVYFHRNSRCYSCRYAEEQTRYTLETYFGNDLANGRLIFRILNLQDSANAESVKKYEPYTSSLFINQATEGTDHIIQVTDIWTEIGNDDGFTAVVKNAVGEALKVS
ncbi:MAG: nitrophenyl compound nitroreductase subunit ArsF family protein [Dehalococcoidia bacterium]|nr:nitrophenyl compound nitroreductase subunit ArsF family protein [Dehalococcoidia bacterium]